AREANQSLPVAGKRQLEDHAQYAVVVILDLAVQPFPAVQDQGLAVLSHLRALVLDVTWGWVLESSLRDPGSEDLPELVEPDLLRHVELDQDQYGALQASVGSADNRRVGLDRVCNHSRDGCFTFHGFHWLPEAGRREDRTPERGAARRLVHLLSQKAGREASGQDSP